MASYSRYQKMLLLTCLLGLVCSGCSGFDWRFWRGKPEPTPESQEDFQTPGSSYVTDDQQVLEHDEPIVVRLHFGVLRIELPKNDIRHSLKIWNHVDENIGDPGLTAILARNGLRIGVADQDAWPALKAIFEENGGRSLSREHTAQSALPLLVDLGEVKDGDTYFLHSRGGKLSGGSFNAGVKRFRIDYSLNESDLGQVDLKIVPVLRETAGKEKYVEQGGKVITVRDYDGKVFRDLTTSVTINPGQFLVIGGSKEADAGYLLGSWWLTSRLDMQQYETVLCITPKPVRIQ